MARRPIRKSPDLLLLAERGERVMDQFTGCLQGVHDTVLLSLELGPQEPVVVRLQRRKLGCPR